MDTTNFIKSLNSLTTQELYRVKDNIIEQLNIVESLVIARHKEAEQTNNFVAQRKVLLVPSKMYAVSGHATTSTPSSAHRTKLSRQQSSAFSSSKPLVSNERLVPTAKTMRALTPPTPRPVPASHVGCWAWTIATSSSTPRSP